MRVLVFTSSYNRPYMLRQCVLSVKNQSYKDITHVINITSENPFNSFALIDDLSVHRAIYSKNSHTHFNNMTAIKCIKNYGDYDLFIKMDDDDIYKKDYVQNIVTVFENNPDVDIVSSEIRLQLNGTDVYLANAKDLGGNTDVDYRMPMTFAFNKKALDAIINLEEKDMFGGDDMVWRIIWRAHKLKHAVVNNAEEIIWHIHGKNDSTASFLKEKGA
jgi:glycosyltransferase involved in cell wall biosynthesis